MLTRLRADSARRLAARICEQLKDLGMGKTRFEVRVEPEQKPAADGMDRVEFMISPNPGEPLRPLASIASGGEISRVMLALKAISVDSEGVDAMIFDEIDTGVSGRMAQVVGEKMCLIAASKQVLSITHLPQIAALGDAHFLVEKVAGENRTDTYVRRLDEQGRIRELSRLVGGASDSESSLSHARHMLEDAARSGLPTFVLAHFPPRMAEPINPDSPYDLCRMLAEYNREHDLFYLCGHLHRSPDATTFHAWSGFPETYLPCLTLQTDERANFEGTGFGEMVEVYADRVVFRVRNFCTGEWAQLNGAPHEAVFTLKNPIPTD